MKTLGGVSKSFGFGLQGDLSCCREKGVRTLSTKIESNFDLSNIYSLLMMQDATNIFTITIIFS